MYSIIRVKRGQVRLLERDGSNPFRSAANKRRQIYVEIIYDLDEYLSDLRKRIIYALIAFMVMIVASLVFVRGLYDYFVSPLSSEHIPTFDFPVRF
ncbi:hypothetical protein [Alicyclobacillus fastidiosus]|uniref:hypothetical protein n=1 Tax=Alicyclobacillus fastidiosus TaxID=392011 RepID=UPI0023E9A50D|nr:hypothetical protein [Alicyclobacillus fastidiosus]GMA62158.1 hypothetical protein GCM10025859_25980 [Alicyclobacillus fastidiosus]